MEDKNISKMDNEKKINEIDEDTYDELLEMSEEEIEEFRNIFNKDIWPQMKLEVKEMSKKDACFTSLLAGIDLANRVLKDNIKSSIDEIKNMSPEEMIQMGKEDSIWSEESFIESLGPQDIEEKMKTFTMKHDEDMIYNCIRCNAKISAHNKDWHNHMCDDCFNKECE